MTRKEIYSEIVYMLELGINAIPIYLTTNEAGQRVEEVPKWKKYQNSKISEAEVKHILSKPTLFYKKAYNGVAVISGKVSGNLSCLDIDIKNSENPEQTIKYALEGLRHYCEGFYDGLLIEKSWSGGLHVFYRKKEGTKGKTQVDIAKSPSGQALIDEFNSAKIIYTDPTERYEIIQSSWDDLPVLSQDQVNCIYAWARTWNEFKEPTKMEKASGTKKKGKKNSLFEETPWDAFNKENTPLDVLEKRGWTVAEERDNRVIITRPGNDVTNAKSAIYEVDKENLWVLTTSVKELNQHDQYSAYDLLVAFEYGGDYNAAWTEVEKEGYGRRIPGAAKKGKKDVWTVFHDYLVFTLGLMKNEITSEVEMNGMPVDEETLNGYYIDMKERNPKVTYLNNQNFWLFVRSTRIPSYNPVISFLEANRRSSHISQIDKLCKCVEPYHEFKMRLLRKWVIGIVANIFHEPFRNIIGPVFYGPPNTGKTTFFERLLPEEFSQYFSEQDAEDNLDSKDGKNKMVRNVLVLFDEFRFAKKVDARSFRAHISKSFFDYREPYARKLKKRKSIASWCAATNYSDFIDESENNRRMIPIEVKAINHDLYNSIDKRDLLLEAYELYKGGEDWTLTHDEATKLAEISKDNEGITAEEELIGKYLLPAERNKAGARRMTATEILEHIQVKSGVLRLPFANSRVIGRHLKNMGFEKYKERVNGRVTQVYYVEKVDPDSRFNYMDDLDFPGSVDERLDRKKADLSKDDEDEDDDVPF